MNDIAFSKMVFDLDLNLFTKINSQSSDEDKQSWLALQCAIRGNKNTYTYLEIGSHLGGSIQQHLADPRCKKIYSIDPRPESQPDERGIKFEYSKNSKETMLNLLKTVDMSHLDKITCFDCVASSVNKSMISPRPDFCFIDGEHTVEAVVSDFDFCFSVIDTKAVIAFHDDYIVYKAIIQIIKKLKTKKVSFTALKLKGATFALFINFPDAAKHQIVQKISTDGIGFLRNQYVNLIISKFFPITMRNLIPSFLKKAVRRITG